MSIPILRQLFNRDLNRLKKEIESYQHEQTIWIIDKEISNTAGNLCLHLVGNLNCYIGATLGNSGYIRNRDLEFSLKNVTQQELVDKILATITIVDETLNQLKEEQLKEEFPILVFEEKTTTEFMLVHLTGHLNYHLGQINYHRRLLDFTASY